MRPSSGWRTRSTRASAGCPTTSRVLARIERGDPGPVLVDVADSPDDLLVIGTGRRSPIGRALRKSIGRYCLAHAKCPVLAVPPSALMAELGDGRMKRSWSLRGRRVLLHEIDREIEQESITESTADAPSHGVC